MAKRRLAVASLPDHYEVTDNEVSVYTVNKQTSQLKQKLYDSSTHMDDVHYTLQDAAKLNKYQVTKLAEVGKRIEEYYGSPQDIEWAGVGDSLFILQSRPITTLNASESVDVVDAPVLANGMGSTFGFATGPARIINDECELNDVQDGDILITNMTTPDYVPAFDQIAGLVTNLGGMTCHAAIVSREFGIPCVVGTGTATNIKNGTTVTVDGYNGLVFAGAVSPDSVLD